MRPYNRDLKIPGWQTGSNFSHVVYIAHAYSTHMALQLRSALIQDVKVPVFCSLYNFLWEARWPNG